MIGCRRGPEPRVGRGWPQLDPWVTPPHSQPRALGYSPRSLREQDAPRCDSRAQERLGPHPSSRGGRSARVKAGARSGPLRTLALREASGEPGLGLGLAV